MLVFSDYKNVQCFQHFLEPTDYQKLELIVSEIFILKHFLSVQCVKERPVGQLTIYHKNIYFKVLDIWS